MSDLPPITQEQIDRADLIRATWEGYRNEAMRHFASGQRFLHLVLKVEQRAVALTPLGPVATMAPIDSVLLTFTPHYPLQKGKVPFWTVEADGAHLDAGPLP